MSWEKDNFKVGDKLTVDNMTNLNDGIELALSDIEALSQNKIDKTEITIDENGAVWYGPHITKIYDFYNDYDQREGLAYSFIFEIFVNGSKQSYGGGDGIGNRTADPNTDIKVDTSWMGWKNGTINKIGYVIDKGTANQKIIWKILDPEITTSSTIIERAGNKAVQITYSIPAAELPKGTHDLSFCALVNDVTYEIGTRTPQYGGGCFSITINNT